jgi:small conductance mechanosensitive channel
MDTEAMQALFISIAVRLGIVVLILLLGWCLGRFARGRIRHYGPRTRLSQSMINLFGFVSYYGILLVAVLISLAVIGVPLASTIASLGAVLVVVGIALRTILTDLAVAIIIYIYQPFKVGDTIETNGVRGKVMEIQLFYTVLQTSDNRLVTIYNSRIQFSGIVNLSAPKVLRDDLDFTISYEDDLQRAKQILEEILSADSRILADPPCEVSVKELGPSGVTLAALPYVNYADYGSIGPDIKERVKLRFEAEGITFPLPHQEVHLIQSNRASSE